MPFLMHRLWKGGIPMAGRKPKPTALKKLEGNPAEIESGTDKGRFSARMLVCCKLMADGK